MTFGLRNAPDVFQRFVHHIFSDEIGVFIQIYFDDIIIYSSDLDNHIKHVKIVLNKLKTNNLFAKLEKCEFHVVQTEFLGFIVSTKGLSMDNSKLDSIKNWPKPPVT